MMSLKAIRTSESIWLKDYYKYTSSLFLHPKWIASVESDNLESIFLNIINSKEEVAGKISGIKECNSGIGGTQLFCYAGFALLPDNSICVNDFLKALYNYASNNGIDRVIISSYDYAPYFTEIKNKYFWTTQRLEYKVILREHSEKNIHSQVKRHLKKAAKTETLFREETGSEIIPTLIQLLNNVRKERFRKFKKDYDPFYLKYFKKETLEKLAENGFAKVYTIQSKQGINAIEFVIEDNNQAYMLLKATDDYGYKTGISSLLSTKVINEYKNRGFAYYNLGGRPSGKDGDGLALYKTRLGATPCLTYGATTNFILHPRKTLNILLNIGRSIPDSKLTNTLKKLI